MRKDTLEEEAEEGVEDILAVSLVLANAAIHPLILKRMAHMGGKLRREVIKESLMMKVELLGRKRRSRRNRRKTRKRRKRRRRKRRRKILMLLGKLPLMERKIFPSSIYPESELPMLLFPI